MKRCRMPRVPPDPLKQERVDELLRIAAAFTGAKRPIPGHVRRELVLLSAHWGKREMPAAVVDAKARLGRSGR